MTMKYTDNSIVLNHIMKDERYRNVSANDCKVRRANMISTGNATKYDLACIQFWIMEKEGRGLFKVQVNGSD